MHSGLHWCHQVLWQQPHPSESCCTSRFPPISAPIKSKNSIFFLINSPHLKIFVANHHITPAIPPNIRASRTHLPISVDVSSNIFNIFPANGRYLASTCFCASLNQSRSSLSNLQSGVSHLSNPSFISLSPLHTIPLSCYSPIYTILKFAYVT